MCHLLANTNAVQIETGLSAIRCDPDMPHISNCTEEEMKRGYKEVKFPPRRPTEVIDLDDNGEPVIINHGDDPVILGGGGRPTGLGGKPSRPLGGNLA